MSALQGISPFVYGTTRLGDEKIPRQERVEMALAVMETGVWFHTARMYGDAPEVLGEAFSRKPDKIPEIIIKMGWENIGQLRESLRECIEPMGVRRVRLGQLCLFRELAEDFVRGGDSLQAFRELKEEGLVGGFVLEVFPWTSDMPLQALLAGHTEGVIDAFIFYLNPLQRFASNRLWEELVRREKNIIAMRTVAGGPVHRLRDEPGFAWKDYLQERASEVAPIFERSGVKDWTEFCVRFAHSFPGVVATIGSTARRENLDRFIGAAKNINPLPGDIVEEIAGLHHRWSDETDIHAEPWTM